MGFNLGGHPNTSTKSGPSGPAPSSFKLGGSHGGSTATSAPVKKGGGGFLHGLEHAVTQTGTDLKDAALNAPGVLVVAGKAVSQDYDAARGKGLKALGLGVDKRTEDALKTNGGTFANTRALAKEAVTQTAGDFRHPLRHPGNTLLDVVGAASVGAGTAARAAAAGKALGEAGDIGKAAAAGKAVKALASKPKPGPRVLRVNDLEVRGHYSKNAAARGVQKAADAALQKGATKSVRVENRLHKRVAKFNQRNERVADATARAPGTRLQALGKNLKPDELRALRIVAEEVPVGRRLGAQEMRAAQATGKELGRHQERIALTKAAMQHLDEANGKPVIGVGARPLLHRTYEALHAASADRGAMLKNLNLLDEAAQQAAKTKAARLAAGATMETQKEATKARGVRPTRARVAQVREYPPRSREVTKPLTEGEARAQLAKLEADHQAVLAKLAEAQGHPSLDPSKYAAEQARRNRINGKIRKSQAGASGAVGKYRGRRELPTVKADALRAAQRTIDQIVARNPDHPVARDYVKREAEISRLQEALNPLPGDTIDKAALGTKTEVIPGKTRRVQLREQQASNGVKATPQLKGAADVTVSPGAPFIGNPVERTKVRGRPKVSSGSTFGHTGKPSSLKTSTGASVEHALERNDVTNIVAERHAEAVRLAKIQRVAQRLSKAGEHAPRRKDDVWVWTDKTVSNERIPAEVKQYLEKPESIASLPERKQGTILQQVRDAMLERHDWRDPDEVAKFTKLAEEGKGVFVPRRLMGELAPRFDPNVGRIPVVDEINNAQKAALIYLKGSYPIAQAISNTGMNLIQQGFAAPRNITTAIRLEKKIGADGAAVVDDIMGQGAVLQAQFEGQGTIGRGTQWLARKASHGVDTPARRAAFLHEAIKAGYDTPAKWKQLITDDAKAGDLAEVAQRAKEAIVDYGDLSAVEKQVVRKILFVYPWTKGATKYAGHFLRDHPVQAAALAQLAVIGKQNADQAFGPLPSYLQGAIPVAGGLVNPTSVNQFQTPAQVGEAVAGLASGNPASPTGSQFLTPAFALALALATRRDDLGFPLKGNLGQNLRDELVAPAPVAQAVTAATHRNPIATALLGSRGPSKSFPSPTDPLYRLGLGGLYPRRYNRAALNQNAAREKVGR